MARTSLSPFRFGGSVTSRDPLLALHREMNRLFEDISQQFGFPAEGPVEGRTLSPSIDVSESEREIRIRAELPGVAEKDVDVTLADDMLTIRGEKTVERDEEKEYFHLTERSYGSFSRAFRLPFLADPDSVQADYENGVLTVTIPKPTETQGRTRKISVRRGNEGGKTIEHAPSEERPKEKENAKRK